MDYQIFKIYDLEAEKVVRGLRVADCMNIFNENSQSVLSDENSVPYNLKELAVSDVLFCSYCKISFSDGLDQRSHYKLDWHRYNLKRALSGHHCIPENVFDTLIDDISSISGSDNEKSSEESSSDISGPSQMVIHESYHSKLKIIRHTKIFFENEENKILSLYRCLLHRRKVTLTNDDLVKSAYNVILSDKNWLVVMLGGGHFAAAIFNNGTVVNHKTFHCYTVRAKQGGSQFSRDNKGGNHSKSAGASLRRFNEQALIQHVQVIIAAWSELIKQCSLIIYRASGPYNRSVLFGGKNPLFKKTDQRLRNIPFPTRRATFKEVKRVYDKLSSIEMYGSADDFKGKFPCSPGRKNEILKTSDNLMEKENVIGDENSLSPEKLNIKKSESEEKPLPQRKISDENSHSFQESDSEDSSDYDLCYNQITLSFENLKEYDDTVPFHLKDSSKKNLQKKKKKKKLYQKDKTKLEKKKWTKKFETIQENLVKSCELGDIILLTENLSIYESLPEKNSEVLEAKKPNDCQFTKEDFIICLNTPVNDENKNTLLHLAALNCLPEFITKLLEMGADPTIRNKNKLTPYVIAKDKETRNSFQSFAASYPNKYDLKLANIPEPLTEEMKKKLEDKKREKKKLKRIKEKIKKSEEKEKQHEEKERERFLALSDTEKSALAAAAERRILISSSADLKCEKPLILSRCFQCGVDITGTIPFEYENNKFCTIPCLKAHRLKTNNYGKAI